MIADVIVIKLGRFEKINNEPQLFGNLSHWRGIG